MRIASVAALLTIALVVTSAAAQTSFYAGPLQSASDSTGTGYANFTFIGPTNAFTRVDYVVYLQDVTGGVTGVTVNLNPARNQTTGPGVTWLFGPQTGAPFLPVTGVVSQGSLRDGQLDNGPNIVAVATVNQLYQIFANGSANVYIGTTKNTAAALRAPVIAGEIPAAILTAATTPGALAPAAGPGAAPTVAPVAGAPAGGPALAPLAPPVLIAPAPAVAPLPAVAPAPGPSVSPLAPAAAPVAAPGPATLLPAVAPAPAPTVAVLPALAPSPTTAPTAAAAPRNAAAPATAAAAPLLVMALLAAMAV